MQKHYVAIPLADGGIETHPLKEWVRAHPEAMPPGFDVNATTSHQARAALRRQGWELVETPTQVTMVSPRAAAEVVEQMSGQADGQDDSLPAPAIFSLEWQLRDFIADNLQTISIDGRALRLYVDDGDREGIEYPTAVGPIDILAVGDDGSFYVFELKRADSSDRVVGRLARHMGWVQQNVGKGRVVHGVIVARTIKQNLRYAASIIPNVRLFEYGVQFTLSPAHDIKAPA